tara:strand:- start:16 stop:231 length:216 start_codon:yes stop_codon:yes gene_type:complete
MHRGLYQKFVRITLKPNIPEKPRRATSIASSFPQNKFTCNGHVIVKEVEMVTSNQPNSQGAADTDVPAMEG